MKKLLWISVLFFTIFVVYRDVTHGTLPTYQNAVATSFQTMANQNKPHRPYKIIKIKAGDTLISVVERELDGPLPVPIQKLMADFEALNPGVQAGSLQIGKSYRFPLYNE